MVSLRAMNLNPLIIRVRRALAIHIAAGLCVVGFVGCGSEVDRPVDALTLEDASADVSDEDGHGSFDGGADAVEDSNVVTGDGGDVPRLDTDDRDAAPADGEVRDVGPEDVTPPHDTEDPAETTDASPPQDGVEDSVGLDIASDIIAVDTIDDVQGDGPFDDLAGLSGDDLRAALLARFTGHTILGYEGVGTARQVLFAVVDAREGRLECIYTGRTVAAENAGAAPLGTEPGPSIDTTPNADCRWPDGSLVIGGCVFNAEHSWPRSQGADYPPASSDLHHIFPTYDNANNQRGSHLFGETVCAGTACPWSEAESELGDRADGQKVFQVRHRFRGDIARAQFYFAVRYARNIDATVEGTLRAWHVEDPPDATERARNALVETYQHNRNPFVDRPDFVGGISDF